MSDMDRQGAASLLVRRQRSAFVRRLWCAPQAVSMNLCADLLLEPPECIAGMDVHVLLEACTGVGPNLADRWQAAVGLFAATPVSELTARQVSGLVALLRFRAGEPPRRDRESAA